MNEVIQMAPRETAGIVAGEMQRFSAVEIRERVNLVQSVMQGIMKKDTHYGTIPGTPKPTLYKPGAEVLCVTFRIAQEYKIEDLGDQHTARFRVTCVGRHHISGIALGEGVGECSSGEEKYKWRGAVCTEEFDLTPETFRRVKFSKYKGNVEKKIQVRTEAADLSNTVLKMACKRAMIAMTLNVTAASDIFTQDIEDLPEELRPVEGAGVPPVNAALRDKWVAAAGAAASADALSATWTAGLAEIKPTGDMGAYNAFKEAVAARGEVLKNGTPPAAPTPAATPTAPPVQTAAMADFDAGMSDDYHPE